MYKRTTLSKLNQFVGCKVELSVNHDITFYYSDFNWNVDEHDRQLILMDGVEEGCRVYIKKDSIGLVQHLNDDMRKDVVDVLFDEENILSVCWVDGMSTPSLTKGGMAV